MPDAPLTFAVLPSTRLRWAVGIVHLLAAGGVLLADLPAGLQALLVAVLAGHLAWWWRRGRVAVRLRARPDGGLDLAAGPDWQAVDLLPDSVVLAWLAVLRYRRPGGRRTETVVVLPDSLDPEAFRRLRVWLKWRAARAGRPAPAERP